MVINKTFTDATPVNIIVVDVVTDSSEATTDHPELIEIDNRLLGDIKEDVLSDSHGIVPSYQLICSLCGWSWRF